MSNSRLSFRLMPWALAAAMLPLAAHAGGYDESVSGDLSNNGLTPTAVTLTPGSNLVSGTTGNGANGVDRDYFTFTIPAGQFLSSLTVLAGTTNGGSQSFIGIAGGNQVTTNPTAGTAAGLLGWTLYGTNDIGVDILPVMGQPDLGSSGFTAPLGAGTYSVWIQETVTGSFNYHFDFGVTAVPEPGTMALWGAGLAALAGIVRRRKA